MTRYPCQKTFERDMNIHTQKICKWDLYIHNRDLHIHNMYVSHDQILVPKRLAKEIWIYTNQYIRKRDLYIHKRDLYIHKMHVSHVMTLMPKRLAKETWIYTQKIYVQETYIYTKKTYIYTIDREGRTCSLHTYIHLRTYIHTFYIQSTHTQNTHERYGYGVAAISRLLEL